MNLAWLWIAVVVLFVLQANCIIAQPTEPFFKTDNYSWPPTNACYTAMTTPDNKTGEGE